MQFVSKTFLALWIQLISLFCYSEEIELALHNAINVYVYQTKYVKSRRLVLENTRLEYDNFKKSLLPAFSLNFSPISFDHSLRLLQNYSTGEYSNVEEYSNTSSGGISIMQKITATGGIFTLGSSISFLREFTNNNNSFSATPMYLSYSQSLFGGGKSMRFEKAISRLKNEMAIKNFCAAVSTEQQKILTLYLEAYSNKVDIDFYTKTVNMGDSLLIHANLRRDAGKMTDYEYNQVEVQQLDSKMA